MHSRMRATRASLAQGDGNKSFTPWLKRPYSPYLKGLFVRIERAEKGSRFDIETRAAWALYYNRPMLEEFIATHVCVARAGI